LVVVTAGGTDQAFYVWSVDPWKEGSVNQVAVRRFIHTHLYRGEVFIRGVVIKFPD